jgi:hypothetical protein
LHHYRCVADTGGDTVEAFYLERLAPAFDEFGDAPLRRGVLPFTVIMRHQAESEEQRQRMGERQIRPSGLEVNLVE